jgi:GTPase SAR1 family protein
MRLVVIGTEYAGKTALIDGLIKERYQRFQIFYHVHVLEDHEDCLVGGFHIEEKIYGRRYYYPDDVFPMRYLRKLESLIPADTILLLLEARPDVIRRRMREAPHPFPIVPSEDVESVSKEFADEYRHSWLERKFRIDTSDLTPEQLLATFGKQVVPYLADRDLMRWQALGLRD